MRAILTNMRDERREAKKSEGFLAKKKRMQMKEKESMRLKKLGSLRAKEKAEQNRRGMLKRKSDRRKKEFEGVRKAKNLGFTGKKDNPFFPSR